MSYRLAAGLVTLGLIIAVQAAAQTLTSRPGAFTGETVFQAPNGRIIGTSKPGAFTGETVFQAPNGRILCTTRPGAFRGTTTTACR